LRSKAQFPLIFALILGGIIIVSALVVYQVGIFHRKAEVGRAFILLNAECDSKRMLLAALVRFTHEYLSTGNVTIAENNASRILLSWRLAFMAAYGASSLRVALVAEGSILQEPTSYTLFLDSESVMVNVTKIEIPEGSVFTCYWDRPFAVSGAHIAVKVDVLSEGIMGWNCSTTSLLAVNITAVYTDSDANQTKVEFKVFDENGWVSNLAKECLKIEYRDPSNGELVEVEDITVIEYLGQGVYRVCFSPGIDPRSLYLTVTDRRGVIVRASTENINV